MSSNTGENRRFGQRVLDWTSLTASKRAALVDVAPYLTADWEHWLGDWEHLEPMMQQLYSFLLFCCCDDKSIRATFKPSYISKYMPQMIKIRGFFQVFLFESPILIFKGVKGTSAKFFALITFPLHTF